MVSKKECLDKATSTLWNVHATIKALADNCACVGLKKMSKTLNGAADEIEPALYLITGASELPEPATTPETKGDFRDSFTKMVDMADEQDLIVYNIHFCRAGIGVQWFDGKKVPGWEDSYPTDYKLGLSTYAYYADLDAMVDGEIARLKALADEADKPTLSHDSEGCEARTYSQLREDLAISDKLLEDRMEVINKIPPCPEHGPQRLPWAEEWIASAVKLIEVVKGMEWIDHDDGYTYCPVCYRRPTKYGHKKDCVLSLALTPLVMGE